MKMKKALALFLSLAMILGLAACSSTSSSSAGASSAAAEEPASSAPVSQETAESDDFQAALDDILANATDDSLQRVLDAGVLTCGCE